MKIGITGAAGFIGMHLARRLLQNGHQVVGIDNLNSSYGTSLPIFRLNEMSGYESFTHFEFDLSVTSTETLVECFGQCEVIFHLAAWPGVRQSHQSPNKYHQNNITAFANIMESLTWIKPRSFYFASSSSVYGDNTSKFASKESDALGGQLKSYYAATKWMNEIEANMYPNLSGTSVTALRFFTVYGPWGRPDMGYWQFLKRLQENMEIDLFGDNGGIRSYTYIDDAVNILSNLASEVLPKDVKALNIAAGGPSSTLEMIGYLAKLLKCEPRFNILPRPSFDVDKTWADTTLLQNFVPYGQGVNLEEGISNFYQWYMNVGRRIG